LFLPAEGADEMRVRLEALVRENAAVSHAHRFAGSKQCRCCCTPAACSG
jgi:hypothetical protein